MKDTTATGQRCAASIHARHCTAVETGLTRVRKRAEAESPNVTGDYAVLLLPAATKMQTRMCLPLRLLHPCACHGHTWHMSCMSVNATTNLHVSEVRSQMECVQCGSFRRWGPNGMSSWRLASKLVPSALLRDPPNSTARRSFQTPASTSIALALRACCSRVLHRSFPPWAHASRHVPRASRAIATVLPAPAPLSDTSLSPSGVVLTHLGRLSPSPSTMLADGSCATAAARHDDNAQWTAPQAPTD